MTKMMTCLSATTSLLLGLGLAGAAQAQDPCPNRGQLDTMYCDANKDGRTSRFVR